MFTPPDKKTRKQRQKEDQEELPTHKRSYQTKSFEEKDEEVTPSMRETPKVEVFDYEELQDDYGF